MSVNNEFYVELSVNANDVYNVCRNNSAKKISNKVYKIPENKLIGFYTVFSELHDTNTTQEVKDCVEALRSSTNDIVVTENRLPLSLYKQKPYEIQKITINKMINCNIQGVFLQQGLGKSNCSVTTFTYHYYKKTADTLLIICPSAVLYTWKKEIMKFSDSFVEDDILICNTGVTEHRRCFDIKDKKIYIMTFDTWKIVAMEYCPKTEKARRKIDKLKVQVKSFTNKGFDGKSVQVKSLRDKIADARHKCTCRKSTLSEILSDRKVMMVADEGHKLANRQSMQTKMIIRERENFVFRYILTGTPLSKYPLNLYALAKVMSRALIHLSYADFEDSLVVKGGYNNKQIEYFKRGALKKLLNDFDPYIIRAFADDWLDLPKQTISFLLYDISNTPFYTIYQNYLKELLEITENMKVIKYQEVKTYMMQILRFLSSPRKDNPRWDVLDSQLKVMIDELETDVIVWSYQPEVLEFLYERYKKYNPVIVHGQNPSTNKTDVREERKDKFIEDPKCKLALFSSLVMDTGITVLNCTNMICVDIHMSTLHHFQLEKRNHRIGQEYKTNVYYLECQKEMDEIASFILERDRHTNENLFHKPDEVLVKKIQEVLKLRDVEIVV